MKGVQRWLVVGLWLCTMLLHGAKAYAYGALKVAAPDAEEDKGEWHLKIRIDLPKAPDTLHLPMRFSFSKLTVYEQTITERGKPPVMNKIRIDPPLKSTFEQLVNFADVRGNVFKSTNYEFDVKRAQGFFEAGEYYLTVTTNDGTEIGTAQRISLKGKNEPVYRGAIEFMTKVDNVDAGAGSKKDPIAAPVASEVAAVGPGSSLIPTGAYEKTPEEELKSKPKNCGCSIPGERTPSGTWLAGTLVALVWIARRSRPVA